MYLFVLTHMLPKTVAGKIGAGVFSAYVVTHVVIDGVKAGKAVTAWTKGKYAQYRGRVAEAARQGAQQGTREAHQAA